MQTDPQVSQSEYRPAVGIMLLNKRGEVLVARRNDLPIEAWQMPQGGIDAGETPMSAAFRELREEIGTDRAVILAESKAWLHYDLPAEVLAKVPPDDCRGQRQRWFVMRFTGADSDINLSTEHPEFDAWKWLPVDDLPTLAVSFKRQVYVDLLREFRSLSPGLGQSLAELMADPIVHLTMAADGVCEDELYELLQQAAKNLRRTASEDTGTGR
jgi:putative (di)nucleoside polyphosphate hydrolase